MREAIILAGGKGTRLKPYTAVIPKPLMPLGDKSIIEIILEQLNKYNFDKVHISLGYLAYMVKASILNHSKKWRFDIEFHDEDKPLGTAGALAKLAPKSKQLLVINGDTLTDLSFIDLLDFHKKQKADITIASYKRFVNIEYGVLITNDTKELQDYQEKPVLKYLVSMGTYVVNPALLHLIPKDSHFDFPTFILKAKKGNHRVSLYIHEGYWRDLGNIADINEAMEDYTKNPSRFL